MKDHWIKKMPIFEILASYNAVAELLDAGPCVAGGPTSYRGPSYKKNYTLNNIYTIKLFSAGIVGPKI